MNTYNLKSPCPRCLLLPEVVDGRYDAGSVRQEVGVYTPHWEFGPPEHEFGDWGECDACDTHPIGQHPAWTAAELAQLEATARE